VILSENPVRWYDSVKVKYKMDGLLFIFLILCGAWYWWDTQQCNEIALAMCQQKCTKAGLQLLDATVTRQRTWLRRTPNGYLQLCRLYGFEYSGDAPSDFGQRELGYIVLIGKQVVETNIPQRHDDIKIIH
jgi:hypothetical protein